MSVADKTLESKSRMTTPSDKTTMEEGNEGRRGAGNRGPKGKSSGGFRAEPKGGAAELLGQTNLSNVPLGGRSRGGGSNGRGSRGGGGRDGDNRMGRRDFVLDRLQSIHGPTLDLPTLDMTEKKFSGRSRLYVGNLSPSTTEEQLKELLSQFGEVGDVFFNGDKHFAFLRMASRAEAEKAKRELDGQQRNGRVLKVRFAPHQGGVRVTNLGPWVSNELLHRAFSIFGDVERCIVLVDERGRSKGEGTVEYERKSSATEAVARCKDGCFFLTSSLRPVVVEMMCEAELTEDDEGFQEKVLPKRSHEFLAEREMGPRFANMGSFEHQYGQKWKALHEVKKLKLEALEQEMKLEEDKLVAQMEYAKYEHETEQLRNQLRMREATRDQQKSQWEERERLMSDRLRAAQERNLENDQRMMGSLQRQEDGLRHRQQENSLFMQAQEISEMLDQQEAEIFKGFGFGSFQEGGFGRGSPDVDFGSSTKRRRF